VFLVDAVLLRFEVQVFSFRGEVEMDTQDGEYHSSPTDQEIGESFQISKPQLQEKVAQLFKFQPHQEQIEAIHHLLTRREDLILIAKTGWGKSVIFQSIPLLHSGKGICLMIMSLSLLEEDQARQINNVE
jgi:superfamily II DNA helicase RecQ